MAVTVEQWDTLELAYESDREYPNPFVDVALSAVFRHGRPADRSPSTASTTADARGGCASCPRSRASGSTNVVAGPSPRRAAGLAPLRERPRAVPPRAAAGRGYHFRHADGTRRYLVSTRVTCQFAGREVRQAVVRFCAENRLNRVFFIMGGIRGTIADLYGGTRGAARFLPLRHPAIPGHRRVRRRAAPRRHHRRALLLLLPGRRPARHDRGPGPGVPPVRHGPVRRLLQRHAVPLQPGGAEAHPGPKGGGGYDPRNHVVGQRHGPLPQGEGGLRRSRHGAQPPGEPGARGDQAELLHAPRRLELPWADLMLRQAQIGALGAVAVLRDDLPEQYLCRAIPGPNNTLFPTFYNPRAYAMQNRLLVDLRRFGIPVVNEEPGYEMKGLGGRDHQGLPLRSLERPDLGVPPLGLLDRRHGRRLLHVGELQDVQHGRSPAGDAEQRRAAVPARAAGLHDRASLLGDGAGQRRRVTGRARRGRPALADELLRGQARRGLPRVLGVRRGRPDHARRRRELSRHTAQPRVGLRDDLGRVEAGCATSCCREANGSCCTGRNRRTLRGDREAPGARRPR